MAQEKYLIMGGDNHFFFSIMVGTVCGLKLYKNLGEQQREANAYRKKLSVSKGNFKFCSLKFTFVGFCAMNMNCVS